ncbi:dynamin family protein, partial [Colletotrichum asianum]
WTSLCSCVRSNLHLGSVLWKFALRRSWILSRHSWTKLLRRLFDRTAPVAQRVRSCPLLSTPSSTRKKTCCQTDWEKLCGNTRKVIMLCLLELISRRLWEGRLLNVPHRKPGTWRSRRNKPMLKQFLQRLTGMGQMSFLTLCKPLRCLPCEHSPTTSLTSQSRAA